MSDVHRSRQRIAGRKVANPAEFKAQMRKAISDRIKLGINSPAEIGRQLGKDRTTIYRYVKKMAAEGLIKLSETGRIEQTEAQAQASDYRELQFDTFVQSYPTVKAWVDDMLVRNNGKPLQSWRKHVGALKRFSDVLKTSPEALLASRQVALELMRSFVLEFRKVSASGPHHYTMTVRNYCAFNGITWARGVSGLMSGKKENFGAYAHIKMSEPQITKAIDTALAWGDRDLAVWVAIGKETCARHLALRDLDITTIEAHEGYLTARAFESKTKKTWTKYVVDPLAQRLLMQKVEEQRAAGKVKLFENHVAPKEFSEQINARLKKLYTAIGLTDPYFFSHPTHALRHVGAHHWLGLTKYNYALVAKIGGWDDPTTLQKCYGEMPGEVVIEALRDARKAFSH
jgi:integrase